MSKAIENLEEGACADLLQVDGNPLENIDLMDEPERTLPSA